MKHLAVLLLAFSVPAMATNGYFSHGYGTKNKALAGAGIALPQDAMIAVTNPAGLAFVDSRFDLGVALFSPSPRSYEAGALTATPSMPPEFPISPGKVESDRDYFFIPHLAKNWVLDEQSAIGLTLYGNGGMNTTYPGSASEGKGTFYGGEAGLNLEQMFISASYARKISQSSALGLSVIFAYQRFEANGLKSFAGFSRDTQNLSNTGVDDGSGVGFKVGWQGEVYSGLTLAASYQPKISMSKFDKYSGLLAQQGRFDIPSHWTVGLAYALNSSDSIVFDVQRINYGEIASISNKMMPALGQCMMGNNDYCLGTDNGPGFGWQDMTVYKLGYQFQLDSMDNFTWRAGYSYGEQPIPDTEVLFNILAPGVIEQHLTFGFTNTLSNGRELNLALMYAVNNKVTGRNPTVASSNQQISLEMQEWELEVSYSW